MGLFQDEIKLIDKDLQALKKMGYIPCYLEDPWDFNNYISISHINDLPERIIERVRKKEYDTFLINYPEPLECENENRVFVYFNNQEKIEEILGIIFCGALYVFVKRYQFNPTSISFEDTSATLNMKTDFIDYSSYIGDFFRRYDIWKTITEFLHRFKEFIKDQEI